jgi:glycosyltransferase involved in cell wall biosynthesis
MASPDLRKRILFIGPVSPPVTGQSLACDILIDGLRNDYVFDIVNLSRDPDSQGNSAIRHILSSLGRVVRVWKLKSRCDLIYFTGAESIGGNLKDLLFYIACIGKLDHVVMHLHGGAGMRRLMRGRTGLFRWLNYPFLSRFGAVIVLGERMRDIFRGAVRPERLKFVANFAEAAHFSTHDDIDAKFDSDGPLCMLFLSNPLPGKGHVEIVEAFAGLDPLIRQKLRVDFAGRFLMQTMKPVSGNPSHPLRSCDIWGRCPESQSGPRWPQHICFCCPLIIPMKASPSAYWRPLPQAVLS